MPAMYAHQCFGDTVYEQLPDTIRQRIAPYRDLYSIGLQGPDIFFYNDPIFWGRIPQYGNRLHGQTGHVFFAAALDLYWKEPNEATAVYLMGVICHYSLDTICHQYINETAAAGGPTHAQQEGDFDRHRIELEGRIPVREDLSAGIHPSREAAAAIRVIYPEVEEDEVYQSLRGCVGFQRLVRCKGDFKRNLFYAVIRLIGKEKSLSPHIIRKEPDPSCRKTTRRLDELFEESIPKAVRMITALDRCLREGCGPEDGRSFLDSADCDRTFEGAERRPDSPRRRGHEM